VYFVMTIQEHLSLAPYTTFNIGGPARFFIRAQTQEQVHDAISFAHQNHLAIFPLGGGSNILVSDHGFNGLVIKIELPGIVYEDYDNHVEVTAGAGVIWDDLVRDTVERGYYGIENLTGVPGTVGAAPVQNIGCYGVDLADVLLSVDAIHIHTNLVETFTSERCHLGYRDSFFKTPKGKEYIVIRVRLHLAKSGSTKYSYHDMKDFFIQRGITHPSLADVRSALVAIRARKGMLQMDGFTRYQTAGSFFKAPTDIDPEHLERIRSIVVAEDEDKARSLEPWFWKQDNDTYKIAPAFLMEFTNFNKKDFYGKMFRGTVSISPTHTLSLINVRDATARDMYLFARVIQDAVKKKFNITLESEVCYVGHFT
jgi:UDP-N-acetylmuramate dehydrogenase